MDKIMNKVAVEYKNLVEKKKLEMAGNLHISIEEYKIIKRDGSQFKMEKRFSEFDELHKKLKQLIANLPPLPAKGFGKLKEESQIVKRKEELNNYIQLLVQRKDVFNSEVMKKFLQIENYAPETQVEPPRLVKQNKQFVMGIRDFIDVKEKRLFLGLLSDMKVTSRVDSYLTNMRMPWEKEQIGVVMSVGQLQLFKVVEEEPCSEDNLQIKFDKIWNIPFASQAICMYFEPNSSTIVVGLDEGKVIVTQLKSETNCTKSELLYENKIHQARIMGVAFDNISQNVYTVSEDKYLKVVSLQTKDIIANYQVGQNPLTNLHFDLQFKRLLISNKSGQIYIYDASCLPIVQLNVLNMTNRCNIRGFHFDPIKNFILASSYDDGELCIFEIEKPGKEKFAKRIATFQSKKKVRSITWSSNRGEIYLGDEEGIITIFNAKIGQSIYALKAHESAVTKLQWNEQENIIISSGKDKSLLHWKLPEYWRDQKLEAEEKNEFLIHQEQKNLEQFKIIQEKAKYDSDEDDLTNWHKF